jgi:hypothetical protein
MRSIVLTRVVMENSDWLGESFPRRQKRKRPHPRVFWNAAKPWLVEFQSYWPCSKHQSDCVHLVTANQQQRKSGNGCLFSTCFETLRVFFGGLTPFSLVGWHQDAEERSFCIFGVEVAGTAFFQNVDKRPGVTTEMTAEGSIAATDTR